MESIHDSLQAMRLIEQKYLPLLVDKELEYDRNHPYPPFFFFHLPSFIVDQSL